MQIFMWKVTDEVPAAASPLRCVWRSQLAFAVLPRIAGAK